MNLEIKPRNLYRKVLAYVLIFIVAAFPFVAACNFIQNEANNFAPTPVASPTASPSPSPSPSPVASASPAAVSDVGSTALFVYGYTCPTGAQPPHSPGIITSNCTEALVTLTPKKPGNNNENSVLHGRNVRWRAILPNGREVYIPDYTSAQAPADAGIAYIHAGPVEQTFNRTIVVKSPRQTGSFELIGELTDPVGVVFTSGKTISIQ